MKRFCLLAALMLLSPSAHAGSSISFVVGGHRIYIESSRHCRSTSCASVSISGIYDSRRKRDRFFDDDDRDAIAPVKPAPPVPQTIAPPALPASPPPVQTLVAAPPPAVYKPAAVTTQVVAPPPPVQQATAMAPPPLPPLPPVPPVPPAPPAAKPADAARPAPQVSRVSQEFEEEISDTPVGDWQTEARGAVRIARCGNALCGYVLNSSSSDKGEAVLINMKPKAAAKWTGSVYSQDSGDTYYGSINMKGPNTLRIEACALGRFYCSGNNWIRISARPESLMTSRQSLAAPRS